MDLGSRIFKYRTINGLTQAQMGEKLKVSNHTICDIEKGKELGQRTMRKLSILMIELEKEN